MKMHPTPTNAKPHNWPMPIKRKFSAIRRSKSADAAHKESVVEKLTDSEFFKSSPNYAGWFLSLNGADQRRQAKRMCYEGGPIDSRGSGGLGLLKSFGDELASSWQYVADLREHHRDLGASHPELDASLHAWLLIATVMLSCYRETCNALACFGEKDSPSAQHRSALELEELHERVAIQMEERSKHGVYSDGEDDVCNKRYQRHGYKDEDFIAFLRKSSFFRTSPAYATWFNALSPLLQAKEAFKMFFVRELLGPKVDPALVYLHEGLTCFYIEGIRRKKSMSHQWKHGGDVKMWFSKHEKKQAAAVLSFLQLLSSIVSRLQNGRRVSAKKWAAVNAQKWPRKSEQRYKWKLRA